MARRNALVVCSLLYAASTFAGAPEMPDCFGQGLTPEQCIAAKKEWARKSDEYYANRPKPVSGWASECQKDRVTLKHKCSIQKGPLQVFHTEQLGVCFAGPTNSYPGRSAIIRIGTFEPITYEGSVVCGKKAVDIAAQLMTEQPGAARGFRWPSGIDEFEFDPSGFKAAFAEFEQMVKDHP